jgi:hypothetical protein
MASLEMEGPFNLTQVQIDARVTKRQAGNYGLGKMASDGKTFTVSYIGRPDIEATTPATSTPPVTGAPAAPAAVFPLTRNMPPGTS